MVENKNHKFVDHYEFDEEFLKKAFAEVHKIYKERGFMREMSLGKVPVIATMDIAKAWMSEGYPSTYDCSEEVCASALKVLEAGRKAGVPIFRTTTGYVGKQQRDLPYWDEKTPMSALDTSSEQLETDPELKPLPEEPIIHKKYASNSFGTHPVQTLNFLGVDTLIVMGATSCACIRHTVMDSTNYGLRTTVPEGAVGNRVPGVIEWNLSDMEVKSVDVVPVDEVVKYLEGVDSNVYTGHERPMGQ